MISEDLNFVPGISDPPQYPIESVDNALRLLLLLQSQPTIRITEASKFLGVATSTAHRILGMLRYRGFLRQNPTSKAYEPGPALSAISYAVRRQVDVRAVVRPLLEDLGRATGETVHFATLEHDHVVFLDAVESGRAVRVASRQGQLLPANCTATGKALLSLLTVEEVHRVFPEELLPSLTDRSIANRFELGKALDEVRRNGYATSNEESEDGVMSVAAGMRSSSGILYGINVSCPAHRMSDALRDEFARLVLRKSKEMLSSIV